MLLGMGGGCGGKVVDKHLCYLNGLVVDSQYFEYIAEIVLRLCWSNDYGLRQAIFMFRKSKN